MKTSVIVGAALTALVSGAAIAKDAKIEKAPSIAGKAMTDRDLDKVVGGLSFNNYGHGPVSNNGQGYAIGHGRGLNGASLRCVNCLE